MPSTPSNIREITETSQVCTFYLRHAWNTDQNTPLQEGVIVLYYNERFLHYINSCRKHYTIISPDYQMRSPSGKTFDSTINQGEWSEEES